MSVTLGDMLAEKIGREHISKNSRLGKALQRRGVPRSMDFRRIERLPRRQWGKAGDLEELVERLTKHLRTPGGSWRLWEVQAAALRELHDWKGLFGPIEVGGGKALISLLAPTVLEVERAVLLVPAQLRDQTYSSVLPEVRRQFKMNPEPVVLAYSELSLEKNVDILEKLRPQLIIADEAHHIRNLKCGRGRRVRRYMNAHPETIFVTLSGTITDRSLRDYWHLALWSLKEDLCPLPTRWTDIGQWADALDEGVPDEKRVSPGALTAFCKDGETPREGFRRRLVETPGVIASPEGTLGTSLIVREREVRVPKEVTEAVARLEATWETPGGDELTEAVDVARHAKELACGFYYRWDPEPPKDWMDARREWKVYVRETLKHNRRNLDTELQVWNECASASKPLRAWQEWKEIKDTFKPNTVPVWLSDFLVDDTLRWLNEEPGIAWVEHVAFGEALAKRGVSYFGAGEKAAKAIAAAQGSIAASINAHGVGKNLQAWYRNLIVCSPSSGKKWEQVIGRTHRHGQAADEVFVDVFRHTDRVREAFRKAVQDARYVSETTGAPRKLLCANILFRYQDS